MWVSWRMPLQLEAELSGPAVSSAWTVQIGRLVWNDRIDEVMTAVFMLVVWIIVARFRTRIVAVTVRGADTSRKGGRGRGVNDRTANRNIASERFLSEYSRQVVRQLSLIAQQIYTELKRLNRGGQHRITCTSDSWRHQTRAFKATLAQR
jgi:hypothetical protein